MAPVEVPAASAICNQNIVEGDKIDIRMFPAQRMWPLDGGMYLGTADSVITKDPDTGRINVGTYRMMIKGPREIGVYTSPGKDATTDRDKWWKMGKPRSSWRGISIRMRLSPKVRSASSPATTDGRAARRPTCGSSGCAIATIR